MPPVMQVDIIQVLQLISLVAGKRNPRLKSFSRGSCCAGEWSWTLVYAPRPLKILPERTEPSTLELSSHYEIVSTTQGPTSDTSPWQVRQHVKHDELLLKNQGKRLEPRVFAWWVNVIVNDLCGQSVRAQTCHERGVSVYTPQPKLVLSEKKKDPTSDQSVKNAKNSNFLSSNCCVPNLWTRTMATKATGFPALSYRTSSLFEGRPHSRILQFLRTVVLFFVLLDGFEEWFKIPAGSLSFNRHVISCILFSLEQSRVVDFTVAEHHPDSILESNVQNFEFSQLLLRRMNDFPRPFCQTARCPSQSIQCPTRTFCICRR